MFRSRIALSVTLLSLLSGSGGFQATAMNLTLADSVPAPGNNLVQLRSLGPSPNPGSAPVDLRRAYSSAEAGAYSVALTGIEHWENSPYFSYDFIVWKRGDSKTAEVLVNVTATGSFADFYKDVPFTVEDGATKATGSINLLLHSLNPPPFCAVKNPYTAGKPLRVNVTSAATYTVVVECDKDSVAPPRVVTISKPDESNPGYWQDVSATSDYFGSPSSPSPTTREFNLLRVTVTPRLWAATGARFRRLSASDGPDDNIVLNAAYSIEPGGVEVPLRVEIPIVFFPSVPVMAAWLFVGAGAGWLATLLLLSVAGKPPRISIALKALFLGPLLAIIAFAVIFLAFSAGCSLTLFGYNVNPSDPLLQFLIGLLCVGAVLLKVDAVLKFVRDKLPGLSLSGAKPLVFVALTCLLAPSARAEKAARYPSLGLSSCPNGDIVALSQDGNIAQFPSAPAGSWRVAGRVDRSISFSELTCATINGKRTVFVVGMSLGNIWVARMDLASGTWTQKIVGKGVSEGIAFDPGAGLVYFSSPNQNFIYRMMPELTGPSQWVSIFNTAAAIGSLAVDSAGRRLLVGAAFSGVVYSVALDSGRQSDFVRGTGTVNSLSIDQAHNLLYIADTGKRTIWSVPLAGAGVRNPKALYASPELSTVSGVAVDAQSNVWFALHGKPDIVELSASGKQLARIR